MSKKIIPIWKDDGSCAEDKRIVDEHFNNHLKKYSWNNGRIVK